jgi:cytochrome P450
MADLSVDPYDTFRRLQESEPVSWIDEIGMWYLTRREDVLAALADTETFTVQHPGSVLESVLGTNMLTTEGEAQYRLRKPFLAAFAPRAVRAVAGAKIERLAHGLIDSFVAAGEADLKRLFADKLALLSVTAVLGLPIHDEDEFRRWYADFADGLGNFTGDPEIAARAAASKAAFAAYVGAQLAALRQTPDDSLLSEVVRSTDLNDAEMIASVCVIIFGGLETTAALIANTLWALLVHPGLLAAVRADFGLLPNVIEESLRWESPVQTCTRQITRDVTVRGVPLRAGEVLQAMLGAANRDSDHFPQPAVFDKVRADADDHVSFGHGKHFCIGAGLARLEGVIGVRAALERLPNLRLHPDHPAKPVGHEFRSPPRLVLAWDVPPLNAEETE